MTLVDIDKNSNDRGSPMPNKHDQITQDAVMAKNTLSTSYKASSATTDIQSGARMIFKNNLLLTYDSQNRVSGVYGLIPSLAPYPVQITALPGYDVFIDILGLASP